MGFFVLTKHQSCGKDVLQDFGKGSKMDDLKPEEVYLHWHDGFEGEVTRGIEGWFHTCEGAAGAGLGAYVPKPKPSTDFTEVHENPYKDYLLFDRHEEEWFVGWFRGEKDKFIWTTHSLDGDEYLDPSHWLPLPNNPLTNSENE